MNYSNNPKEEIEMKKYDGGMAMYYGDLVNDIDDLVSLIEQLDIEDIDEFGSLEEAILIPIPQINLERFENEIENYYCTSVISDHETRYELTDKIRNDIIAINEKIKNHLIPLYISGEKLDISDYIDNIFPKK